VAFVPFGLIYALLALAGWDHWFVAVVALAGGFLAARFVWAALERRVFVEPIDVVEEISVVVCSASISSTAVLPTFTCLAACAADSPTPSPVFGVCGLPPYPTQAHEWKFSG